MRVITRLADVAGVLQCQQSLLSTEKPQKNVPQDKTVTELWKDSSNSADNNRKAETAARNALWEHVTRLI